MGILGAIITGLLALAKASILVFVLLIAIPLAFVLFLLGAIGRWNSARGRQSRPDSGGGTVDLVKCPTCGDWVEGSCSRPECAVPGGGEG